MWGGSSFSLKQKLFALIGLLGVIPLLGAALTYGLFTVSKSAEVAMDTATQGAIYLERIDGQVNAVVMESRGIYMSPDWKVAEPYGKLLLKRLAEMQETAKLWKGKVVAAERAKIDALAQAIDEFVRFRTELVVSPARRARRERDSTATTTPIERCARRSTSSSRIWRKPISVTPRLPMRSWRGSTG